MLAVLSAFAPLFSRPTYLKLLQIAAGHFLCRGRRTMTNCLRKIGLTDDRRYSAFYDVFRRARWSSFKASKILLFLIDKKFLTGGTVSIVVDTTLERRRGPRIYGKGMHRDAVRSSKTKKAFSVGHNWLVACVLVRFPGTKTVWSLPFISILLRPKNALEPHEQVDQVAGRRRHKKVTTYTEQLVHVIRRWLGYERSIVLIADSAFCCRRICRACIRRNVTFCANFRMNASLFSPPPPPTKRRGRRRIVGGRLPNLNEVAANPDTVWEKQTVPWYGGATCQLELATGTALWYHNSSGKPVPIRWVLSRNPETPTEIIPILCTNPNYSPVQIIGCYVSRWTIESTFQEVRLHLGYESIFTWSKMGIERVSPMVMASFSLVCLIAAKAIQEEGSEIQPQKTAWYSKSHITFSDVHQYVKLLIINENIFPHVRFFRALRKNKVLDLLYWALAG